MMFLVVLAGFMHVRQVDKRHSKHAAAEGLAFITGGAPHAAPPRGGAGAEGAGGWGPPEESEDGPGARKRGAAGGGVRDGGRDTGTAYDTWGAGPPPERIPDAPKSPSGKRGKARRSTDQGDGPSSSGGDPTPPASDDGADDTVPTEPPLWHDGAAAAAADFGPARAGSLRPPCVAHQPSDAKSSRSFMDKLFSVGPLRDAGTTLYAPGGSFLDPKAAERAAAAAAAARRTRFWVSDILKLLITHLQLLGLLRGLRITWPKDVDDSVSK